MPATRIWPTAGVSSDKELKRPVSFSARRLVAYLVISLVVGCAEPSRQPPSATPSRHNLPATDPQDTAEIRARVAKVAERTRAEFLLIADELENGANPYLGREPLTRLKNLLNDSDPTRQLALRFSLSGHLLRIGKTEDAIRHIELAFDQIAAIGRQPNTGMRMARAIAYLRHAEVQNCIRRQHAECCIFPLHGRGIHADQTAMREARRSINQILAKEPDNLLCQWLLNICSMALGDFPNAVPSAFRIPSAVFEQDLSSAPIGRFVNVAHDLKVDTYDLCGGVSVEDFDRDGDLDIATSTFDPRQSMKLHRNEGNGSFSDQTQSSGLGGQLGGLNCLSGDYDNDGDMDLVVLRGAWLMDDGRIRNSLLQNLGNGTFVDVTEEAGLASPACPTQTAAWLDFDNDGDLDLYVGNESRKNRPDAGGDYPNQLFENQGDGTFKDIASSAGVTNDRYCKGVAVGDFDNDGWLDIYVSNVGPNRLYRNQGDATFVDVASTHGVTRPEDRSFACWFFDYDNDGWLDLFVAGYSATPADLLADYRGQSHGATLPRLYRNSGDTMGSSTGRQFEDVTETVGLDHVYLPMGASYGDFDGDGFFDIYLATGEPSFEALMPNAALWNNGGRKFVDVTCLAGLGHLQKGHGVAFADFDDDGDQDLYHQLGGFYPGDAYHNALFLNPGNSHRRIVIELQGVDTNRQAIGARLSVELDSPSGRRVIHRSIGSVSSFGGSSLIRQDIGLGNATSILAVNVYWPRTQRKQRFDHVPMDESIRIVENADTWIRQ